VANGSSTEWMVKLQESLNDLKIGSVGILNKLDQLSENVTKLDVTIEGLKNISSSQETRLSVLEAQVKASCERVPENLNEEFVLMRAQLKNYQKFLWIVAAGLIAVAIKMIFAA
jgi:predicted  nucleic acid-binding Zn-ribbon protein